MASLVPTPYRPEARFGISPRSIASHRPADLPARQDPHPRASDSWASEPSRTPKNPKLGKRCSAWKVDRSQAADVGHAALGEAVGGDGGGDALGVAQAEDLERRVVDLRGALLGPLEHESLDLVGHLDHAAGVHDVVRRVE